MVVKTKVETHIERLYCQICMSNEETVEMDKDTTVLMCDPPIYMYTCPACGYKITRRKSYPHISYNEVV
jgi:uncharacterized protein YlaI